MSYTAGEDELGRPTPDSECKCGELVRRSKVESCRGFFGGCNAPDGNKTVGTANSNVSGRKPSHACAYCRRGLGLEKWSVDLVYGSSVEDLFIVLGGATY